MTARNYHSLKQAGINPSIIRSGFLRKDGTGQIEADEDYSSGVQSFSAGPPAGELWVVRRMIATVSANSAMRPDRYGGQAGPLTNGIIVQFANADGATAVLNAALPIKRNQDWGSLIFDANNLGAGAAGVDAYVIRWTFANDLGNGVLLNGDTGDKVEILLNDDFSTGITAHTFRLPAVSVRAPQN